MRILFVSSILLSIILSGATNASGAEKKRTGYVQPPSLPSKVKKSGIVGTRLLRKQDIVRRSISKVPSSQQIKVMQTIAAAYAKSLNRSALRHRWTGFIRNEKRRGRISSQKETKILVNVMDRYIRTQLQTRQFALARTRMAPSNTGEDAQLANLELQKSLQQLQQTLQVMSNISKMLHDSAMSVIRNWEG
jgi:hypothetical protein